MAGGVFQEHSTSVNFILRQRISVKVILVSHLHWFYFHYLILSVLLPITARGEGQTSPSPDLRPLTHCAP